VSGESIRAALMGLLSDMHLSAPSDVPRMVADHARSLGAREAVVYLVDYDQRVLIPLRRPDDPQRQDLAVDGTVAGRCFRTLEVQESAGNGDGRRLWVPVLDGTERVGVLELVFANGDGDGADHEDAIAFAGMVAELIVTKNVYGDSFENVRRRQPMSLASELAWRLLPPLAFATTRVAISAAVVPTYDLGGDAFDYAVDGDTARFAVFDAMGHGLQAGLLSTVAIAAYRNSRRAGLDLTSTVQTIDQAIYAHFGPERFVTALLAELDLPSGRLCWTVSGHPPPFLLRGGKSVKTLGGNIGLPLGLGEHEAVADEMLEPGDEVLLFTDGVVEARSPAGEFFGVDRLTDLAVRASGSGLPPPEQMRRLLHAILDHQEGTLQDDATVVIVEWKGEGGRQMRPSP
jgi:serine phosphatase RsbU (regulator of sigma subunit)